MAATSEPPQEIPAGGGAFAALGAAAAVPATTIPIASVAETAAGIATAGAAVAATASAAALALSLRTVRRDFPEVPESEVERMLAVYADAFAEEGRRRLADAIRRSLELPDRKTWIEGLERRASSSQVAALARERAQTREGPREAAVRRALDKERRLARQHARAQVGRATGMANQRRLERTSPEGAVWVRNLQVNSTPECRALHGLLLPHAILRRTAPPLHAGCACVIRSPAQARAMGVRVRVLDPREAGRVFADAMALHEGDAEALQMVLELGVRGALPAQEALGPGLAGRGGIFDEDDVRRGPGGRFAEKPDAPAAVPSGPFWGDDERRFSLEARAARPGWEEQLTEEQRVVAHDYTSRYEGGGWRELNEAMREGRELSPEQQERAKTLGAVIEQAGTFGEPSPTVWRGLTLDVGDLGIEAVGLMRPERDQLIYERTADLVEKRFPVGSEVVLNGFSSSSFYVDPALDGSLSSSSPGVILEMVTDRGALLDPLSRYDDEGELLLPPGLRFRVASVVRRAPFRRESGADVERPVVRLEVIPDGS